MYQTRIFLARSSYKLVTFQVSEGQDISFPDGSIIVDTVPFYAEDNTEVMEGIYFWVLCPIESVKVFQDG